MPAASHASHRPADRCLDLARKVRSGLDGLSIHWPQVWVCVKQAIPAEIQKRLVFFLGAQRTIHQVQEIILHLWVLKQSDLGNRRFHKYL
jgi:hypothetical protein